LRIGKVERVVRRGHDVPEKQVRGGEIQKKTRREKEIRRKQ